MKSSNVVWALVAGLAIGYIFGNKFPMSGGSSSTSASSSSSSTGAMAVGGDIPSDWITEKDIGATDAFAGLTPAQRFIALKVLNNKPCDCGCPHGSIAKCKKEDPGCPVAPKEIEIAAREAKAGKTYDQVFALVKKPDGGGGGAPAEPTHYKMQMAAWTPVRGPKTAKVTIVMFSDFQCPFCGRVEPTLKQIADTYGKDVRIAWRNQPLPFHNNAMPAAEAAMAANAQGKFWPMHDKLFANQQALDRPSLDKDAEELGLNMAKYKAAMDQHLYKDQIDKDSKDGTAAGASGTPAFFINGQFLSGAQPFDSFKKVIDAEMKKADELIKKGTSMDKLYQAELDALPAK